MRNKKLRKRWILCIGVIISLILVLNGAYKIFLDPYRGTVKAMSESKNLEDVLTREEALNDLEYIIERLTERHPACMDGLPNKVEAQLKREITELPDEVTVLQLWQAAARVLARMGDAHTNIGYKGTNLRTLPLRFEMSENRLLCTSDGYEGAEIVSINDNPVTLLHTKFLDQFSFELESYGTYNFGRLLPYNVYLAFIGIDTTSDIKIKFRGEDKEWEEFLSFSEPEPVTQTSEDPFVFYEIDKDYSLGVFTLKSCINNDFYKSTLNQFIMEVKQQNIKHIAVDLRYNGGGNSSVINEFLQYLDIDEYTVIGGMDVRYGPILYHFDKMVQENKKAVDLLYSGKVYALTSTNSFSSAEMFANTIQDNGIGLIIGEIPGNMPSSYGDILTFQAPNSKLVFYISYKYFSRIDETKADLPLIPDFEVKAEDALTKLRDIIGK